MGTKQRKPKRTTRQALIGEQGVSVVRKAVTDMGFYWHDRRIDFGVDGVVEVIDPQSLEATGITVDVQIKTTRSRFSGETDDHFTFTCTQADIDYWLRSGHPVILVCVRLDSGEAWFKHLNSWFANPSHRRSGKVEFDKMLDLFEVGAASRIVDIATPVGYVAPRVAQPERLVSNLLRVERFAPQLYSAPTSCRDRGEAWAIMREKGEFESGFHLVDERIYSLAPLETGPLAALVNGGVEGNPTEQWASTDDPVIQRKFVALLNFTLRAIHHRDLAWHPEKKLTYFTAPPDRSRRRVKHSSRGSGRTVFSVYRKDDGTTIKYCRHMAADLRFRRYGSAWYLEIDPTYHYTWDGRNDFRYSSDLLKGMKLRERNPAVRDSVKTWAAFLRGEDSLLATHDPRMIFSGLLEFFVDVGIDDRAWKMADPVPEGPATEEPHPDQTRLALP